MNTPKEYTVFIRSASHGSMGTYTCTSIAAVRKHIAQVARLFGFTLTYPQIDKKAQEKLSDMTFHLTKKLPGMGDTMRVHVTTKETA